MKIFAVNFTPTSKLFRLYDFHKYNMRSRRMFRQAQRTQCLFKDRYICRCTTLFVILVKTIETLQPFRLRDYSKTLHAKVSRFNCENVIE